VCMHVYARVCTCVCVCTHVCIHARESGYWLRSRSLPRRDMLSTLTTTTITTTPTLCVAAFTQLNRKQNIWSVLQQWIELAASRMRKHKVHHPSSEQWSHYLSEVIRMREICQQYPLDDLVLGHNDLNAFNVCVCVCVCVCVK
jgi:thiamine kinase-like enzyme